MRPTFTVTDHMRTLKPLVAALALAAHSCTAVAAHTAPHTAVQALHSFVHDLAPKDGAAVPSRIHLLPPSGFSGRDGRGPYFYDPAVLQAAFEKYGMPLPIDYEHQSLDAAYKSSPTPAAGWMTALEFDDQGCWATVEWTATAAAHIGSREYRYLSPVFEYWLDTGGITQLTGAGLTNNPNLYLTSLNNRGAKSAAFVPSTSATAENAHTKGLSKHMRDLLIKLFGLQADATDEAITQAAEAAHAAAAHAKTAAEAVGATTTADIVTAAQSKFGVDTSTYVAKADFEAMSKRATDAEASLAKHQKDTQAAEVAAVIESAKTAGKLTPAQVAHAQKLGETNPQLLKDFLADAAPVVTSGETASGSHAQEGADLTDAQKYLCRISGMTEAAFRKQLAATTATNV